MGHAFAWLVLLLGTCPAASSREPRWRRASERRFAAGSGTPAEVLVAARHGHRDFRQLVRGAHGTRGLEAGSVKEILLDDVDHAEKHIGAHGVNDSAKAKDDPVEAAKDDTAEAVRQVSDASDVVDSANERAQAANDSVHKAKEAANDPARAANEAAEEVQADEVGKAIIEGDSGIVDDARHRGKESVDEMANLTNSMNDMFESNQHLLEVLMPGLKARTSSLVTLPFTVFCGIVWLFVYFKTWYKLDHEEYLIRASDTSIDMHKSVDFLGSSESLSWEDRRHAALVDLEEEPLQHAHADMIFVFHHPSFKFSDMDKKISCSTLRRSITHRNDAGFFVEFEKMIENHEKRVREASITEQHKSRFKSLVGAEVLEMTMHDTRVLVLKDMVRSLPLLGFNVKLFSSIDCDELFLCVSLSRPEVIQHYLQRESIELQTTHAVVERLKIVQDPRDPCSSPPFVRYDQKIVTALHKAKVIDEPDEKEFYRVYHDRDVEGSVMSSRERIRVIQRELTRFLNLEATKEAGIIRDWYPCHSELWLQKLQKTWSSWETLQDMSFVQPVPLLREYFGSQLAYSFAWQGVWCKGLLCLAIFAIVITAIKSGQTLVLEHNIYPEKQIMPFAIITLIWGRVVTNLWRREEEYFQTLWNQESIHDQIVRPSFEGVMMKSEVDENVMEETVPKHKAIGLRVMSVTITLICCLLVMVIMGAWVHGHDGDLDVVASMFLSLMVKIFELLYNTLSAKLVEVENHKYDQDFHDSWVWQQFLFQAVNNYWACIAVAFSQKVSGKCPADGGCFQSLQGQVSMLLVILLGCSIGLCLFERVQVWLVLKCEDWNLEHREDKADAKRHFLEEQSKYAQYDMRAQVENMLQLVIGLGFVLLFGTLQPLVVPLCLIHFLCSMRIRALLLTWFSRRSLPHKLIGIGAWDSVMSVLLNMSVFFSGVLVVYWGRFFKGALLLAKITGLVVWIMGIFMLWALVDIAVTPVSVEASTLGKRRFYTQRVIIEATLDAHVAVEGAVATGELLEDGSADGFGEAEEAPDYPCEEDLTSNTPTDGMSSVGRRRSSLLMTDTISHRAVRVPLDCELDVLVPQGHSVCAEEWDEIPRLGSKRNTPRSPGGGSRPSTPRESGGGLRTPRGGRPSPRGGSGTPRGGGRPLSDIEEAGSA